MNDVVLWGGSYNCTFDSVDEILWCYRSNETSLAVLSHGTIYLSCSSNFFVCGQNPMEWPFKWNLLGSSFMWCYLFLKILRNEIWDFCWICLWSHLAGKGLSNAVFEQCTSTGSEAFSPLICLYASCQMCLYLLNFLHLQRRIAQKFKQNHGARIQKVYLR